MKIQQNLIFDLGIHQGADTSYYLKKGYTVIGIDADPDLIDKATNTFQKYILQKRIFLLHAAITNFEGTIRFNLSNNSSWNSINLSIANREALFKKSINVPTKLLSSLFDYYGTPFYCKIDIEGYDAIALETLQTQKTLPTFISTETECLGEFDASNDQQSLKTLKLLYTLGYRNFKLIDQRTLLTLQPKISFYESHILKKLIMKEINILSLFLKTGHIFRYGSSGPFGPELKGKWLNYTDAQETLLFHKKSFKKINRSNYKFWCDWHAKF